MKYRVDRQAGYVIHTRAYRDTSMIVDFFTIEFGKVSAVVRGARRPNSKQRALLQPFTPLNLSWQGRSELKTLLTLEAADQPLMLVGHSLMCGLYLNELLQRLLSPAEGMPKLYVYYQYALNELRAESDVEGALRTFERKLLSELGFGLEMSAIVAEETYQLSPTGELIRTDLADQRYKSAPSIPGRMLIDIANDNYQAAQVRIVAKYLMRERLKPLLGDKPLRSRELFVKLAMPSDVLKEPSNDRS